MFKRKKHQIPELNTTSTADISFMLLIFFLVTSSMDVDKGLVRMLPPLAPEEEQQQATDIDQRNVLRLRLDADGTLTCDDEPTDLGRLRSQVVEFVGTKADREQHVIQIDADREAHYDAYFQLQNEIVAAYRQLREREAKRRYGRTLAQCTPEEREAVASYYQQRIAEVNHAEEGGRP